MIIFYITVQLIIHGSVAAVDGHVFLDHSTTIEECVKQVTDSFNQVGTVLKVDCTTDERR